MAATRVLYSSYRPEHCPGKKGGPTHDVPPQRTSRSFRRTVQPRRIGRRVPGKMLRPRLQTVPHRFKVFLIYRCYTLFTGRGTPA